MIVFFLELNVIFYKKNQWNYNGGYQLLYFYKIMIIFI